MINRQDIEEKVDGLVNDILAEQIIWQAGFGITKRRNGETIVGVPRDTIDTGVTRDTFYVDVAPDKISIHFTDAAAEYIFKWREEFGDITVDGVVQEFSSDIAAYVVGKVLGR